MQEIKEIASLPELLEELDALGVEGFQRYRAVNRYISMKARYRDIPVSGTFELTPLCNLDCKMCYVHLNQNQIGEGERLLTVDEWKNIINQAAEAGMIYATLTGGECLTYPGFKEVYLHLVSLGIQPDILTNGRLLTEEMVAFFTRYPPGVMQVTLYGSNEDAYERVCGHRAFQQVMDGIERAKRAGLNISLTTTPNRYMQKDISALLDLLHAQDLHYEIGEATLPARPETGRELDDFVYDMDAYIAMLKEEEAYTNSLRASGKLRYIPQYMPANCRALKGLPCGGAHSSFHVNWKGEICPCIAFSSTVHYSLMENGFAAAWERIRTAMHAYKPPKECIQCAHKDYCITCPGEKCMSTIGGDLNKYICQRFKRLIEEGMIGMKTSVSDRTSSFE